MPYLRTWFLFDVCIVLFDWVAYIIGGTMSHTVRPMRVLRIVRLLRLMRYDDMGKACAFASTVQVHVYRSWSLSKCEAQRRAWRVSRW